MLRIAEWLQLEEGPLERPLLKQYCPEPVAQACDQMALSYP